MTVVSSPELVETIADDVARSFPSVWREILGDRPIRRAARLCLISCLAYTAITAQDLTTTILYTVGIVGLVAVEVGFVWLHYVAKSPFSCESLSKRVISVESGQILVRQGKMSATIPVRHAHWREIQSVPQEFNDRGFPDISCIVITDPGKSLWSRCAIILCGFDEASRTTWRQLLNDGGAQQAGGNIVADSSFGAKD